MTSHPFHPVTRSYGFLFFFLGINIESEAVRILYLSYYPNKPLHILLQQKDTYIHI